ncbi:hypothetical protein ACIPPS_28315 [Streptomyces sp. NPDC090127]|uniref:hypothetical protein n=1 Tax=Streptomyces sp. NPDC090127 TaxID=3365953 RepID=UPI0038174A5D
MSEELSNVTAPEPEPVTAPEPEPATVPEPEPVTAPEPEPATAPEPETVTAPESAPAAEKQAPRRRSKVLTVVLPAVLVLGAIGGGVTYTGVTVRSADRSAETIVWADDETPPQDDPASREANYGKASTPLSKLLLPTPQGYVLGPDTESYGNDDEVGPAEAAALMKREGQGLSGKKRREYEKRVDKLGLKGIAVRTFVSDDSETVVYLRVTQMKDKKQIRAAFELKNDFFEFLEFPKGPKISGHKNSACFKAPEVRGLDKKEKSRQLDQVVCSAYDSEVEVTITVSGRKGHLDEESEVAQLMKKQLDHITSPGEYV